MATRRAAAAHTANKSYSETIAEAEADDTRDKTATGEPLVMTDAANKAVDAFDPQPHAENPFPVLSATNPNLVYDPALANAGLSDEQVEAYAALADA